MKGKQKEILKILNEFTEASEKMFNNGLTISHYSDRRRHHVDDEQLIELSKLFEREIETYKTEFESKQVTIGSIKVECHVFFAWKYKEDKL